MNNLEDFDLNIPFKGARDYLQSADVYDAAMRRLKDVLGETKLSDVRLLFQGFARKQLKATQHPGTAPSRASLTFGCAGEKTRLDFIETERGVTERRPFPEEKIIERCHLELAAERATLTDDGNQAFSLMESIVAINKALHLQLFAQHRGKWLFTEVKTAQPLYGILWKETRVQLKHRLGLKLTRAAITLDGEEAGYICFSLMQ